MDTITIYFAGEFYAHDFKGYKHLKDVIRDYGFDRKAIKEWYRH